MTFYNFDRWANQSDYMVSAYSYSDLVVPKVQFMNNDTAFAVGDSRLMIYSGTQKPVTAENTYMTTRSSRFSTVINM